MKPRMTATRRRPRAWAAPARLSLGRRWLRAGAAAFHGCCWLALAFGVASAVYLTWRTSSDLRTVPWIPYPVARWADYHGRTRNLAAYAILALPVLVLFRDRRAQARWMAALALFATALEYGQLFIPTRWFEWQDIALSLVGLALAWALVEGFRLGMRSLSVEGNARRYRMR